MYVQLILVTSILFIGLSACGRSDTFDSPKESPSATVVPPTYTAISISPTVEAMLVSPTLEATIIPEVTIRPISTVSPLMPDIIFGLEETPIPSTTQPSFHMLTFMAGGPVNLLLKDPEGRRLGIDPVTGQQIAEIPTAIYARQNGQTQLVIPLPAYGTYHVQFTSVGTGEYYGWHSYINEDLPPPTENPDLPGFVPEVYGEATPGMQASFEFAIP